MCEIRKEKVIVSTHTGEHNPHSSSMERNIIINYKHKLFTPKWKLCTKIITGGQKLQRIKSLHGLKKLSTFTEIVYLLWLILVVSYRRKKLVRKDSLIISCD